MFHTKLITDKLLRLFFFNIIWYHWVAVKMWAPAHSLTRSRAHIMRCVCVKYLLIHWLVSAAASSSSSVFFILFLYFSSQWHDVWAPMHAVLAKRWIVVVNTMPSHYTQSCFRSSAQRFRGFFSIFFVTFSLSVSLSLGCCLMCVVPFFPSTSLKYYITWLLLPITRTTIVSVSTMFALHILLKHLILRSQSYFFSLVVLSSHCCCCCCYPHSRFNVLLLILIFTSTNIHTHTHKRIRRMQSIHPFYCCCFFIFVWFVFFVLSSLYSHSIYGNIIIVHRWTKEKRSIH